jgi:hypothetical protein
VILIVSQVVGNNQLSCSGLAIVIGPKDTMLLQVVGGEFLGILLSLFCAASLQSRPEIRVVQEGAAEMCAFLNFIALEMLVGFLKA